ncbi:MAG: hypothetical protein KDK97_09315 [Verrucomicrobiales bacterium]|nr:hypothetical protein [Verrucomicrobiales bacterium]MCP5558913.1 hypothetical protein [Verrucomicrobiaceae bacterium]
MKTNTKIKDEGPPTLAGNLPKGQEHKFKSASLAEAEWGRLPEPRGRCPISGLSRSAVLDLGVTVPGLLVRLRKPGAIRGAVLVHLPTLREYLRQCREAQIGKGDAGV